MVWNSRVIKPRFASFILRIVLMLTLSCMSYQNMAGKEINYERFMKENGNRDLRYLNSSGWKAIRNHALDSAMAYYSITISRYSDNMSTEELEHVGKALINTGTIWLFIRNKPEKAWPLLNSAMKIGKAHNIASVRVGAGANMAKIYTDYNDIFKALDIYTEALDEAIENHLDWGVTMAFVDLVSVAFENGRLQSTEPSLAKILAYDFNPDVPLNSYCRNLATAARLINAGNGMEAAKILENAESQINPIYDSRRYIVNHKLLVALCYLSAKDYTKSIELLKATADRAAAEGFTDIVQSVYEKLGEAYSETGNPGLSRQTQSKALQIRDSLYSVGRFEVMKDLEAEGTLSDIRKKMNQSRIREEKARLTVIIVSAIVTAVLLLLLLLLSNYRKLKLSYRDLFLKNLELAERGGEREETPPATGGGSIADSTKEKESSPKGKDDEERETMKGILDKVRKVIEESPEVYSPDFSLDRLSELTGIRSQHISQTIAELTGKNLSALVARQRMNKACLMLADPSLSGKMTVESIAESVGYKSRTYFSKIFKEHSGLSPKEFIHQARMNVKTQQ